MATLIYNTVKFNDPGLIPKEKYEELKSKYKKDPEYNIISEYDSFHEMVSGFYLWMGISILVMIIGVGIGEGIPTAIGGMAFVSFMFSVIYYILEAPSKSKFVKERDEYLKKLEAAIKESSDYNDFTRFYRVIGNEFYKTYLLSESRQR